jgi:hypothetical protein
LQGENSVFLKISPSEWEIDFSPRYTVKNPEVSKPDCKPSLLWQPEVTMENGKAIIDFFTTNNLARHHIFVDGISKSGKICLGTGFF